MQAVPPDIDVPGDSPDRIMHRSGYCVGMNPTLAVWRFGFIFGSESARAYHTSVAWSADGFLWVLATRKTGLIKDTWRGYAVDLPDKFRKVYQWEPS